MLQLQLHQLLVSIIIVLVCFLFVFLIKSENKSIQCTVFLAASQPFHVIAVRTMAQFIGQEQKYT